MTARLAYRGTRPLPIEEGFTSAVQAYAEAVIQEGDGSQPPGARVPLNSVWALQFDRPKDARDLALSLLAAHDGMRDARDEADLNGKEAGHGH